eukprot:m.241090 g.241090  ORF g.241090 m.241090 type:complete len:808 (-) comp13782_c0_seq1:109-2532(-)
MEESITWWLARVTGLDTLHGRIGALAVAGLLCLGGGIGALYAFSQADWFHKAYPAGQWPSDWTGFNESDFVAVVFFTFLTPVGFALLFSVFQHFMRVSSLESPRAHVGVFLIGAAAFAGVILFGLYWASNFIECMGFACLDVSKYKPFDPLKPEAGLGWQIVTGASLLFASVGIVIALMCSLTHRRIVVNEYSMDSALIPADPVNLFATNLTRDWLVYLAYLAVLIPFAFTTTYMPDTWEYFTADRIAQSAAQKVSFALCGSGNVPVCNYPVGCSFYKYMCPELPTATFNTPQVELADFWVLKFFPSNVSFYIYIVGISFLAMVVRSVPPLRRFSARRIRVAALDLYLSMAELFMAAATFVLVFVWCWYWLHDHNFNGYFPGMYPFQSEVVARSCGQFAVLFMSLLMFPASRASIMGSVFGVSWEAGIKYHRWLGVLFLVASFCHLIGTYSWYADVGQFPNYISTLYFVGNLGSIGSWHLNGSMDNFTIPLMMVILWFSLIALAVFAAIERFRRKQFELFYYMHYVSYTTLIAGVLWHASASWEFLLPGVALWFFDRCVRIYRSARAVDIVKITPLDCGAAGNVTEIRCTAPIKFFPGQYCFLNVANVSLLEWHPFTISSAPHGDLTFHIKDMGANTFTGRLFDCASQLDSLLVSVDGPYGLPIDYSKYSTVLLVAGGIGVTPIKSIFESLRQSPLPATRVHMLWVVRDGALLHIMDKVLHDLPQGPFSAELYIDNPALPAETIPSGSPPNTTVGRPNFSRALKSVVGLADPSSVLLFVCGPPPVANACEGLCFEEGWEFHTETFAL